MTHAQELAKYGQISWGYNISVAASLVLLGGSVETGTIITDKGWARNYVTTYYSPCFSSPSASHSFFFIYSTDNKNLPVFSDWNGLSKGISGSFDFVALGGGLGSNYALWSLGVSLAPESIDVLNMSKNGGALNVGKTSWIGGPYKLPDGGASQRYINTMQYQGGY